MDLHKKYHGFKVEDSRFVAEVNAQAYMLRHEVSGARLMYLACSDDNKVFYIGFRTPPADDTGVAHILEHSTLCGSRKYHLKEPFVDLVKGSLNTFLNAMTYPDKTVYPVASRNAKDFRNLVDVYLDAVFYPLIYENDFTLMQEGWHYELTPDGKLEYNGVVYNEMKGVYSAPDAELEYQSQRALFPDSPYRFESGGLPEKIPALTREAFLDFHRTYYSPENSYIYLYGDLDIDAALEHLDSYLKDFPRTGKVRSEIPLQPPLSRTAEYAGTYSVAEGEDSAHKTYHELDIVTGDCTDFYTTFALRLLCDVLLTSESAPLRRALLDAGMGRDVSGNFIASMRQPIFSIRASGSDPEKRDEFLSVIYRMLQKLTREGLDKELLEAVLNAAEFKLREADFGVYPKGLIFGLGVLDSWIYDADPIASLEYNTCLKKLREAIGTDYFERLTEKYLLDNTHKVLLTLTPEQGKETRERQTEAKRLEGLRLSMTSAELEKIRREACELHARQAAPDSAEARASIPVLQRRDIKRETEIVPNEIEFSGVRSLLYIPQATNRITYLNFYFDATGLAPELLPYTNLFCDVLGKFNTADYSYSDLSMLTYKYTGGISYYTAVLSNVNDCDKYSIRLALDAKALTSQLPRLFDILSSLALRSEFTDVNRFRTLVGQIKADWDDSFFSRGQEIALARLRSYFSLSGRVAECDYYTYYHFITDLYENFDEKAEAALAKLREVSRALFNSSAFVAGYSCDADDRECVRKQTQAFLCSLPKSESAARAPLTLEAPGHNEAITTPGKVQYVTAGGNFRAHGYGYTGAMQVLATMLRYEYLWTKIRVQGGAYGANAQFARNGIVTLSTYRDPKLKESLEAFAELPGWLRTLKLSERELTKYVIGTISALDTPLTASMKAKRAAVDYIIGSTPEERQQTRNQVLDVTLDDIKALADTIEAVLGDKHYCVVGGGQVIAGASELFENVLRM